MNNLLNMQNNLIQNFYIIGLSPEDVFKKSEKDTSANKLIDIFTSENKVELTPKIISKFPPTENYNLIPNEIIIEHCFPNGLKAEKAHNKDLINKVSNFHFELDNLKYNYLANNSSFYSKVYFTCLKFREKLQDYQKLKSAIDSNIDSEMNNIINDNNSNEINDTNLLYIPKVICLATLLPFSKEMTKILNNLYDYFLYYNSNMSNTSLISNLSPIEKVIEQIVMCLPLPVSNKNEYCLSYKFNYPVNSINSFSTINTSNNSINNLKNNLNPSINQNRINNFPYDNPNITFPVYDPLKCYKNDTYTIPLDTIFYYFNEEEAIKIFKYIFLEIPILFFSENTEALSQIIQGFLSLLEPFEYVLPNITVLPSRFYGIMNSESRFIFGIAENYSPDFFKNNNILLDKTIIVVNLSKIKKIKIEEVKRLEDQKDYVIIDNYNIFNYINNESVLPNGTKIDAINIDFPLKIKKKFNNKLKSYINEIKKKKDINSNKKIRFLFYRFIINILSGYTDYLLKVNTYFLNNNNIISYHSGDSIRYKINYTNSSNLNSATNYNNQILFIKSVFNMDDFISKFPKDNQSFYKVFFNTKLFHNFIREIIFSNDERVCLNHKYFDLLTYLKKHKEIRKQKQYKDLYSKCKNPFDKKNHEKQDSKKNYVNILNDSNFNLDEKRIIIDNNKAKEALTNYNQLVTTVNISNQIQISNGNNNILNNQIILKYFIFPKLLFDNQYFGINYEKLFYRHYLEMPGSKEIIDLYSELKRLNKHYYDNYFLLLFSKFQNEINAASKGLTDLERNSLNVNFFGNNTNNANMNPNLEVLVDNYVEYNWLLLMSCSLWYCSNAIETEIRINKIFDVLEKIDLIEEQVLFFVYMSIYNFGNKSQFIKMFEFLNRFMGYASYTYLLLLCLKLNEKEDSMNNNEIKDNSNSNFKMRSFCDISEIRKNAKNENSNEINVINENKVNKTKDNKNKENNSSSNNSNQKEEIVFFTMQKCQNCQKDNQINSISEMIHHRISQKRDHLFYKCSGCGEINMEVYIKYKLSLNNKKKNESILISHGQFKLIPPHKIYQKLKEKFLNLKDYKLDIDHIFSYDDLYLLNNIFYFSDRMLPFDFLIPYEGRDDRDYFMEEEEEEEDDNIINDKKEEINKINEGFSIFNSNDNNFSIIGKD